MSAWVGYAGSKPGMTGRVRLRYLDTARARREGKAKLAMFARVKAMAKFKAAREDAGKRHREHMENVRASKTLPARLGKVWGAVKGAFNKAFGRGQ